MGFDPPASAGWQGDKKPSGSFDETTNSKHFQNTHISQREPNRLKLAGWDYLQRTTALKELFR
jgi:hypothetical protein